MQNEFIDDAEAYLTNQFSGKERLAFEQRLEESAELREAFITQQILHEGMLMLSIEQQLKKISQQERQIDYEPIMVSTTVRTVDWSKIAVAAAIGFTLLFGGTYLWKMTLNPLKKPGSTTIADRLPVKPTADGPTTIVDSTNLSNPSTNSTAVILEDSRLFAAYFRKEPHSSPTTILKSEDELDGGFSEDSLTVVNDSSAVRAGIRLLAEHKPTNAITLLQKITLPGHWRACAEWYIALAYLQQNRTGSARNLVRRIASLNGHPYQKEATNLLTDLRTIRPKP